MSSANDNISVAEDPPGSPSPPSEDGFVEVTGVLFNTAFSGTFEFAPEWSLSQIAHNLHGRISENAQQVFELASPLGLRGMDVFKSATIPDLQKPINELQTNNDLDAKYLIVFDPPSDKTNFVETYIRTNKENLATARGDRLIRDEETLKTKEGKRQKQIRTNVEPLSQLQVHQMLQKFREEYDTKISKQDQLVAEQQSTIAEQQKALAGQQKALAEQQKTLAMLSDKVTHQAHTLNALHRRVVLDQARDTIIDRYGFKLSELRLGGYQNLSERQTALRSLLKLVREKLVPEDSAILSDDALKMIFDGSKYTIRNAGNEVAHQALTSDISLAVLEGGLTQKQLDILASIYRFTHNKEPELQ